jgi:hypothetical protein
MEGNIGGHEYQFDLLSIGLEWRNFSFCLLLEVGIRTCWNLGCLVPFVHLVAGVHVARNF